MHSDHSAIIRGCIVALALMYHVSVLAWEAARHGPNWDELWHLSAGLSVWELGRFDLYSVNPPLIKTVAALPAHLAGAENHWSNYRIGPGVRGEARVGEDFLLTNGEAAFRYLTWGRWALIPLSVFGAMVCRQWAYELYGRAAGTGALVLWCVSPTIAAGASVVNADAGAAVLGVSFGYTFWRWQCSPSNGRAVITGICLGLAELTKFSWLILLPLTPLLAVASAYRVSGKEAVRRAAHSAIILAVALYLLNFGYLFQGTFRPLKSYVFVSHTLGGEHASDPSQGYEGNRFRGTYLGPVPVPLPTAYLAGIDIQKRDFERGRQSYLLGRWKEGGWRHFYVVAAVVKEPLGLLLLVGWRLSTLLTGPKREDVINGLFLLTPAVALFVLVSFETGFTIHYRYVLPCWPFAFVWVSRIFSAFETASHRLAFIATALCAWMTWSGVAVLPHSHSHFNEIAGRARGGHRWLLDSNIDWGEDLFDLREWCRSHPDARPLYVAANLSLPLDFACPEALNAHTVVELPSQGHRERPPSGWYVISVNALHDPKGRFRWFLSRQPDGAVAYSMYVYHVE